MSPSLLSSYSYIRCLTYGRFFPLAYCVLVPIAGPLDLVAASKIDVLKSTRCGFFRSSFEPWRVFLASLRPRTLPKKEQIMAQPCSATTSSPTSKSHRSVTVRPKAARQSRLRTSVLGLRPVLSGREPSVVRTYVFIPTMKLCTGDSKITPSKKIDLTITLSSKTLTSFHPKIPLQLSLALVHPLNVLLVIPPEALRTHPHTAPQNSGRVPQKEVTHTLSVGPKISQVLGRPTPWTADAEKGVVTVAAAKRPSSTPSGSITSGDNIIVVRTDQTPLKPPQSKNVLIAQKSKASFIKIETDFTKFDSGQEIPQPSHVPEQRSHQQTQTSELPAQASSYKSSRKSSINRKHIFSAPLQLLRRASLPRLPKRLKAQTTAKTPVPSPVQRDARMPDHPTQLKRNYTAEALQRASGVLQEMKQGSQISLRPAGVIKPVRWRTFSNRSISQHPKKEPKTTHGIISGIANKIQVPSHEQLSDVQSYSSSVRNLRMGLVPTTTPDEKATYKIKRSPSAQTEEFLKVDISIRGGTSYLPSEARRIHTPPLPEEGADGRWKGFFFDYNAPRRKSSFPGFGKYQGEPDSQTASPGSIISSDLDRNWLLPDSGPKLDRKPTKNKCIVTGDWYDMKLAELDMEIPTDQEEIQIARDGDRRINCSDVLTKIQEKKKFMYEGQKVEPEMFDLTIPEHLPSSPLCPRHPRYWRVIKGKGSQFRGCWMHGVGVYEEVVKT